MRKALIKIKSKPVQPVRGVENQYYYLDNNQCNLEDITDWAKTFGVKLSDVKYEHNYDIYDDHGTPYFVLKAPEDQQKYNDRVNKYNKDIAKYNQWYNANKVLIEKELKLREADELASKKRAVEKAKRDAEKKKASLQKQLVHIQAELKKFGANNGTKP